MESAHTSVQDKVQDVASRLGPNVDDARESLGELNRRVATFIREQPGTCLLGALALGFIIGRIASR
jgi:hypothetical protein